MHSFCINVSTVTRVFQNVSNLLLKWCVHEKKCRMEDYMLFMAYAYNQSNIAYGSLEKVVTITFLILLMLVRLKYIFI